MKTTAQLFDECLATVQNDVKMELDMSFALADKIDMILREKNISQKQLAKKMGKTEAEVSRWLGGTHNFTLMWMEGGQTGLIRRLIICNDTEGIHQPAFGLYDE